MPPPAAGRTSTGTSTSTDSFQTQTYQSRTSTARSSHGGGGGGGGGSARAASACRTRSVTTEETTHSTADTAFCPEEACRRYEALLSQLTKQAIAQQREIRSLKARLTTHGPRATERSEKDHAVEGPPRGSDDARSVNTENHESTEDMIARISGAIAQEYLEASDAFLAECMARRLRRVTQAHVRRSLDNAIARERSSNRSTQAVNVGQQQQTDSLLSSLTSPDVSAIEKEESSTMLPSTATSSTTAAGSQRESMLSGGRPSGPKSAGTAVHATVPPANAVSGMTSKSGDLTFESADGEDAMSYLLRVFSSGSTGTSSSHSTPGHRPLPPPASHERGHPMDDGRQNREAEATARQGKHFASANSFSSSLLHSSADAGQTYVTSSPSPPPRTPESKPPLAGRSLAARQLTYGADGGVHSRRPSSPLEYLLCAFSPN